MTQYAQTPDLADVGLPESALTQVTSAVQNAHLLLNGALMDTYLRAHHTLPFTVPYPNELVQCDAVMSAYTILQNHRGYAPADVDDGFRSRYEDCIRWLEKLASGAVSIDQGADATPNTSEGAPRFQTGGADVIHATGTIGNTRGW